MVNSDLVRHLAELSKIKFTDDELQGMTADMANIIKLMDKVRDFPSDKPVYSLDAVEYKKLRSDEFKASSPTAEIIANAENVKNNCFVVPKVV